MLALGDRILSDWSGGIDRQRTRALKDVDRQNREAILRTILANIASATAATEGGAIVPSLGVGLRAAKQRSTRYDRPGFRGLPSVIELMADTGALSLYRSRSKGTVSLLAPSASMVAALRRCELAPSHFGQQSDGETIILTRKSPRGRRISEGDGQRGEWIDYRDTAVSRRFRAEMEAINRFLADASMAFEDDGGPMVATHARSLRRYFSHPPGTLLHRTPRFDFGGRLFGGGSRPAWWSDLPKHRRKGIRLNGEPIADLDFSCMFLRLAYIEAGLPPPAEADLYAGIPGLSGARWRSGVKKAASALLFRSGPLQRVPKGVAENLPKGIKARELRAAIRARHPALADLFETGVGMHLMFVESQVMVAALLRCAESRLVVLPMHDGLMVPRSMADLAAGIMRDAALAVTGYTLPVSLKATYCGLTS